MTCASAASSTVSRRNRSSLALVFSSECGISCAMSSASGKEAARAQHDDRQALLLEGHAAEMLGRELRHAIDVARLEERRVLGDPGRALRAAGAACPDGARDHHRGRRGEDEAVDTGRHRRLEQVERALDVDGHERARRVADDVGLVQGACMDHRGDPMARDHVLDGRAVGDRGDDSGIGARLHVEPHHPMPVPPQPRGERPAEPAGRACEKNAHGSARKLKPAPSSGLRASADQASFR